MKRTPNKIQKTTLVLVFLFIQLPSFADSGFADDVNDVPVAPIDIYIIPAVLLGLLFVYLLFRRKNSL